MKKASRILLTVGGALDIVSAVGFFIAAFYMLLASTIFGITGTSIMFYYDPEVAEESASMVMSIMAVVYVFVGLSFIACGVLAIIASKKTFAARDNADKGQLITIIVLNALLDNPAAIVGSIFGLITLNKEKNEKETEVVD